MKRNEVAYAAVIAQLVRFGLTPAAAALAMQSATEDQPEYWAHAVDCALLDTEVNLFFKKYDHLGVQTIEAELFVPTPTGDRDPDTWARLATGLEAQRKAFADSVRAGELIDAPEVQVDTKADDDPVVTFEIGSTIRRALKAVRNSRVSETK